MAYSYDNPLVTTRLVGAAVNFASQTAQIIPCRAVAALAHGNGSRILAEATVLGLHGIVTTVGTGTIQLGDGSDIDRYGTFTIEESPTLNGALQGTLVLTDDGFRMGVSDLAAPGVFTATFAGTAVVANLTLLLGHF